MAECLSNEGEQIEINFKCYTIIYEVKNTDEINDIIIMLPAAT